MHDRLLIANRGEIALRIIRTARRLGIHTIAVYSDADRFTPPVLAADAAYRLGPSVPAESYLDKDAILAACVESGAQAVHPGYGFLSEDAAFAEMLETAGIEFVGPRPEHLRAFGLKHRARALARDAGVMLLPGSGLLSDVSEALEAAQAVGYPVMLKSTGGGGGIGMQLCHDAIELAQRFDTVRRLAESHFGDARVYLERYVANARHVEVQIFGDGKGSIVTLGERDCSLQRRHQKVIEEAPAPGLSEGVRRSIHAAAAALGRSIAYESAGTVEFVYDVAREQAYFLEVNTRLQVEHPVTEAIFGIDLVEWMIRQRGGDFALPAQETLMPRGHAIEARLYAEDPARGFRPSAGRLTQVTFPVGLRVDGWVETGSEVSPFYDPLLAKLIVSAPSRTEAIRKLETALAETRLAGIETNRDYLRSVVDTPWFARAEVSTGRLAEHAYAPRTVEVIAPGVQSSLQDLPGRLGFWAVGVPPSGPMDDRSHRLVNRILGNAPEAATLECTYRGPTLRFNVDATIALGGARMSADLDGRGVPQWQPIPVAAGQVLRLGEIEGPGQRTYLAVAGGFDAPLYLGSRSTFSLGGFGGHATGVLKAGDTLHLSAPPNHAGDATAEPDARPQLSADWLIDVVYGPHGAPDFFTEDDIATLFEARYEVHFNSARTGVRLIGPRPSWARSDGGEAGLHPSNLHDNAYAIGSLDFTGDMPIILGPDGPSLGGFVCPGVVAAHDLWKCGQLKPGDQVRFRPVAMDDPVAGPTIIRAPDAGSPIIGRMEKTDVPVVYRRAGESNLLVEYGPMTLDIGSRLRVQLLYERLLALELDGIIDLTPGIRSLQLHYDPSVLDRRRLLDLLQAIEWELPAIDAVRVPSRIVHLPLSWNDPAAELAMRKYQELVRPDAPWCPSNIEFIRRINGLDSIEDVRRTVFDASYLVLGLGDVYLGAPVATPIDPRHRLVTTKYNPARTWTPENAVGIGGAYLCIYGMEGPGGYQLFGRTIQMWNSWHTTPEFAPGTPWLLRFFDQIRFFPVSGQELLEAREAFPHGRYPVEITETEFSHADYLKMLEANRTEIETVRSARAASFNAERLDWQQKGLDRFYSDADTASVIEDALPPGCAAVASTMSGSVWRILVQPGDLVAPGDPVLVLEAMKMEIAVPAIEGGRVREIRVAEGRVVQAGQTVVILEPA